MCSEGVGGGFGKWVRFRRLVVNGCALETRQKWFHIPFACFIDMRTQNANIGVPITFCISFFVSIRSFCSCFLFLSLGSPWNWCLGSAHLNANEEKCGKCVFVRMGEAGYWLVCTYKPHNIEGKTQNISRRKREREIYV